MGRRAGGKNYAPLMRGYVAKILEENKEEVFGKLKDAIVKDPITALKDLSWLVPKELLMDIEADVSLALNTNQLPDEVLQAVQLMRELQDAGIDVTRLVELRDSGALATAIGSSDSGVLLEG